LREICSGVAEFFTPAAEAVSLIASIESFCALSGTASAILAVMLVPRSRMDTRAKISLDVFLRLTAMDVCCGPPAAA
jgi:hypothetical protein